MTEEPKLGFSMVAKLTCGDCRFWVGRCRRGKLNRIASSEACELFAKGVCTEIMTIEILKMERVSNGNAT